MTGLHGSVPLGTVPRKPYKAMGIVELRKRCRELARTVASLQAQAEYWRKQCNGRKKRGTP